MSSENSPQPTGPAQAGPADDPLPEALALAQGAADAGLGLKLLGGLAVRVPDAAALDIIRRHAARIAAVTEEEMRAAIRIIFSDTHNIAEGAGAAPFAAALQERDHLRGKKVAVVQSGGNIDRAQFAEILAEAD